MSKSGARRLVRGLSLFDAMSVVICSIIGTGVFLKTAVMAQYAGTPVLVMAAWVVAGMMSLAGALTYAELGAMYPDAGGDYVYLRAAYGEAPAFLYGWMFVTACAAGPAALAYAFVVFLEAVMPFGSVWIERSFHLFGEDVVWRFGTRQVMAVAVILLCAVFNSAKVAVSGRIQSAFTVIKIIAVIGIAGSIFAFSDGGSWTNMLKPEGAKAWSGMKLFGAAMMASLWAYNGWNFLPMVAGEVKNPGRNVPRALFLGMMLVLVLYLGANLAYFYALPFADILTSNSTAYRDALPVASKALGTFLGPAGIKFVSVLFVISTLGTLHSELLTIPRIPYAMARDGLFFKVFGVLGKRTNVPLFSIWIWAAFACVIACSGTFDQLTTIYIFSTWLFYAMTATSIFVLRMKQPDTERPYKTTGYPWVPAVFVLVALWLCINTIITMPIESIFSIVMLLPGLPLYWYFRRSRGSNG